MSDRITWSSTFEPRQHFDLIHRVASQLDLHPVAPLPS